MIPGDCVKHILSLKGLLSLKEPSFSGMGCQWGHLLVVVSLELHSDWQGKSRNQIHITLSPPKSWFFQMVSP